MNTTPTTIRVRGATTVVRVGMPVGIGRGGLGLESEYHLARHRAGAGLECRHCVSNELVAD